MSAARACSDASIRDRFTAALPTRVALAFRWLQSALVFPKVAYLLYFMMAGCLFPFMAVLYADRGMNKTEVGLLSGTTPLLVFVGASWNIMADATHSHKLVFVACVLACALLSSGLYLSYDPLTVALAAVVLTIFSSPLSSLIDSRVLLMLPDKGTYGRQRLFGALGWGLAAALMGSLTDWAHTYDVLFVCYASMGVIVAVWFVVAFDPRKCSYPSTPSAATAAAAATASSSSTSKNHHGDDEHRVQPLPNKSAKDAAKAWAAYEPEMRKHFTAVNTTSANHDAADTEQSEEERTKLSVVHHMLAPHAETVSTTSEPALTDTTNTTTTAGTKDSGYIWVAEELALEAQQDGNDDTDEHDEEELARADTEQASSAMVVIQLGGAESIGQAEQEREHMIEHHDATQDSSSHPSGAATDLTATAPWHVRIGKLLSSKDVWYFLVVIYLMGIGAAFVEIYLFLFLTETLGAERTLLGLCVAFTVVMEFPFFFFSKWLLARLGSRGMIVLAHFAYISRVVAYSFLYDPWWVLPIELLHGVTFACLWYEASARARTQDRRILTHYWHWRWRCRSAGVVYVQSIAPKGLEATSQGLFGGTFGGLGRATGAVIGGIIFDYLGPRWLFRIAACSESASLVFFLLTHTPMVSTDATTETEAATTGQKLPTATPTGQADIEQSVEHESEEIELQVVGAEDKEALVAPDASSPEAFE